MSERERIDLALACVRQALGATPRVLATLAGGPASDSWLVDLRAERAVLRYDRGLASELGLDRAAELRLLHGVAAAGIGPQVIFADPQHGILVTRFIDGRAWDDDDLRNPAQLLRLGELLGDLHRLPIPARSSDLRGALRDYAHLVGTRDASRLADEAEALLDGARDCALRLCHNDITAPNVIDDGRLWLIDWEYAGLGNSFFDLAVTVSHHDLDATGAQTLLDAWPGGGESWAAAELERFCAVYDRLAILWSAVVERHRAPSAG